MPDELLQERDVSQAQSALTKSPLYLIRQIQVQRAGDSLLLTGRVDSYYHKQMAQEIVRAVCSGIQLVNSIEVE